MPCCLAKSESTAKPPGASASGAKENERLFSALSLENDTVVAPDAASSTFVTPFAAAVRLPPPLTATLKR